MIRIVNGKIHIDILRSIWNWACWNSTPIIFGFIFVSTIIGVCSTVYSIASEHDNRIYTLVEPGGKTYTSKGIISFEDGFAVFINKDTGKLTMINKTGLTITRIK